MSFEPKNPAAGIKNLRTTAKWLLAWADDLEKAGKENPPGIYALGAYEMFSPLVPVTRVRMAMRRIPHRSN